jgi:hypothetical protein
MDAARQARSIVGDRREGRPESEFYPTPPEAVYKLLLVETLADAVWEPACGDGAISRILASYYSVVSSDLYDHGYGRVGVDFLTEPLPAGVRTIATNPPFKLAEQFIERAKSLDVDRFIFLLKLAALEGDRRSRLMENTGLSRVWVFRKRLTMTRNGETSRNGGMIAFAWFVWDRHHDGRAEVGWI